MAFLVSFITNIKNIFLNVIFDSGEIEENTVQQEDLTNVKTENYTYCQNIKQKDEIDHSEIVHTHYNQHHQDFIEIGDKMV